MNSPLIKCLNISLFKNLLVILMGLWEEHLVSFKGLELYNESPLLTQSKWEWISDPLNCPPNEKCKPKSTVKTMNPLEGVYDDGR